MEPIARLELTALDCPDPDALADFYSRVTGWPIGEREADWVELDSGSGPTLAFQHVPDHRPPTWPDPPGAQQLHLDFLVRDLDEGERAVIALGARRTDVQPAPDSFRVLLDPAGHPYCLVLDA
jgi:catechol 2,3-dioxygenase-like lactoylglutathione lyase family enzyme